MPLLQQHLQTNSLPLHKWELFNIEQIVGGSTPDGVRFLTLFLRDYSKLFSEQVNAGCSKCLNNYLKNYKEKLFKMENNCKYKLKAMYNGLPLEFGSNILIHNGNITNAYAKELLKRYDKDMIFDEYPIKEETKQKTK